MHLSRIRGENFRLFGQLEFEPQPRLNLILGANAAGKTSLLEAIFTLGRGRSFRGLPPETAGRAGPEWLLHGRVSYPKDPEGAIGLSWSEDGLKIRADQADTTVQDLVRRFPVQVLEPDSHRLLEDGPAYRRRYLDWGVFHVEHRFFPEWRRYQRALRQRNQALKAQQSRAAVEAWNAELVSAGEMVQACRESNLQQLREFLGLEIARLLNESEWSLSLIRGWPVPQSLVEAMTSHYEQDRRQGKTTTGPHRAELKLRLSGRSAKHQVSRGQQKLLVAALLLAQARLIAQHTSRPPVLLVDDFPAELGPEYQQALLAALTDYPGQVFMTAIERSDVLKSVPENAVFHVEHGSVSPARLV